MEKKPYRLGIALSGGGARGFAHVGALKALEEAGMKPDIIAGVSAGAVVAVLYASGMPIEDFLPMFAETKFSDFCKFTFREGGGLFTLEKFGKFITEVAGVKNIEDLKIPTYIGATDFDHGKPVYFDSGAIADRVVASCSIPIVFRPVLIDDVTYVDGGVLRNLPAWTIRDKCETLVGINVSPLTGYSHKSSMFEVAMRTYNLMAKTNQNEDMQMCDLVIKTPELAKYQVFNLKDIKKVYLSGYAAAHRAVRDWKRRNSIE